MKLVFTYSDHPDLTNLPKDDIYQTSLEIPDESLYLIGCRERVLAIAEYVSRLTNGSLHITCKELDLKNHPVKLAEVDVRRGLRFNEHATILYFEQTFPFRTHRRLLKIWSPIDPLVPNPYLLRRGKNKRQRNMLSKHLLSFGTSWCKSDTDRAYVQKLDQLKDQMLVFLNAQPVADPNYSWHCRGYHPWWWDDDLIEANKQRFKRQQVQAEKQRKLEERQKAREEKLKAAGIELPQVPQTGAGRRPGARPGIFKGVQMRSQLEIRFAAELEERGIRWVYEGMVLGQGGYLVDFYLPDLACWVEVKGRFEPRDRILLREVSADLKRERQERIFVYGQSRAWVVNSSGFREINHERFWSLVHKL